MTLFGFAARAVGPRIAARAVGQRKSKGLHQSILPLLVPVSTPCRQLFCDTFPPLLLLPPSRNL